jgi:hypothetical protein
VISPTTGVSGSAATLGREVFMRSGRYLARSP